MALSQKALQKKRERKDLKRKQTRKSLGQDVPASGFMRQWTNAVSMPLADVFVPANLFEIGIGSVLISRRLPNGDYAAGVFMLDVFCLGIKNAIYRIFEADEYKYLLLGIYMDAGAPLSELKQSPAYARKLVEEAELYARALGFEPQTDYRLAKMIFGEIDSSSCPDAFRFGRDGKPCFISGPYDSPQRIKEIINQLEQKCGADKFDFVIQAGDEDEAFGTVEPF